MASAYQTSDKNGDVGQRMGGGWGAMEARGMAREGGPREGEGGRGSYIFSEVLRRRGHRITTIAYRFVHLCVLVQLLGADVGPEGDQLADVLRTHFTKGQSNHVFAEEQSARISGAGAQVHLSASPRLPPDRTRRGWLQAPAISPHSGTALINGCLRA